MYIRLGFDIVYDCPAPTPMILMLSIRPERFDDLITPQILRLDPAMAAHEYRDDFGNLCTRLTAPEGEARFWSDFIIADSGAPDVMGVGARQQRIDDLPDDVLIYLLASRYCDCDRLAPTAWRLFGDTEPGWPRAQAVREFVHERIAFGYRHARPTRTAFEAFEEGVGVGRDFAHLGIALSRCLHMPARYVTGYLGDIGVPPAGTMDFSAWYEVWLDGRWWTMDARHDLPRVGRVAMAHGRDAVDAALSTTFGATGLVRFDVIAEEVLEAAPGTA
jgi:transglutaminase-like putative cysteine protease